MSEPKRVPADVAAAVVAATASIVTTYTGFAGGSKKDLVELIRAVQDALLDGVAELPRH